MMRQVEGCDKGETVYHQPMCLLCCDSSDELHRLSKHLALKNRKTGIDPVISCQALGYS